MIKIEEINLPAELVYIYQTLKKSDADLSAKVEELEKKVGKLESLISHMTEDQLGVEEELMLKFAEVINAKKEKIKELEFDAAHIG